WSATELSRDGRWLVQDVPWQALYVWDLQTGKRVCEITTLQQTSFIGGQDRQATFSPDGKQLAAIGYDGQTTLVRVWYRRTAKILFAKNRADVRGWAGKLTFSPDGTCLLLPFPSGTGGTSCWDIASGRPVWQNKNIVPRSLAFTHDGKILSAQERVTVIDAAT